MSGRYIEEDLFVNQSIIDPNLPEGRKIHAFLMSRAVALAGNHIDFSKHPVTFVLSDSDEPNAFFASAYNPKNKPKRDRDYTVRYIKNPLNTDVICISKGLIEMVDSLDELDYVLGHELTHMLMRILGVKGNSKGEEELADLHAVDLMYDAGSDPKHALHINEKINTYVDNRKDEIWRKRHRGSFEDKEKGIDWTQIFDVHMTSNNRTAGLEASLTRLSHLIDDRKPSQIDKSLFDVDYHDPVTDFLKQNDYANKNPIGKLKILIDCIESISGYQEPKAFFETAMKELMQADPEIAGWRVAEKIEEIQKCVDEGYTRYFHGPTINKHYQQKIATLAEGIIESAKQEREWAPTDNKPAEIDTRILSGYLQDKAYKHIERHGYPDIKDFNYLEASGVLYSYFYCFCTENSPSQKRSANKRAASVSTEIEKDIADIKKSIKKAETFDQFTAAHKRLKRLLHIVDDIRDMGRGREDGQKLDNLSGIRTYGLSKDYTLAKVYADEVSGGLVVPWQNLYEFALQTPETKEYVVRFLSEQDITDYRLTHNLPYVEMGHRSSYAIDKAGTLSKNKIPHYELEYATRGKEVLAAYDYIKSYFDREAAYVDETCKIALNVNDADYRQFETTTDRFNQTTIASKKSYDLVSMFNALPEDEERRTTSLPYVISLIPDRYRLDYPMPGLIKGTDGRRDWRLTLDEQLFDFENPIFLQHFNADYKNKLIEQKDVIRQKMFDALLDVLDVTRDAWLEAKPVCEDLRKKSDGLLDEIRQAEDENTRAAKYEEHSKLEAELHHYREKEDAAGSLVYNFLSGIFKNNSFGQSVWTLNRLRPEEAEKLALYALKDEKGAIVRLYDNERYEHFCDYLKVLGQQTDKVIAGDYEWIDRMRIVATNHEYVPARTKEELRAFAEKNQGKRYAREEKKYNWYLHVFDAMRYLETNNDIDVNFLSIALQSIKEEGRSSNGFHDGEIVRERFANYRNLLKSNALLSLLTKAFDHADNYKDLSFDEAIEMLDNMAEVREQFGDALGKRIKSPHTHEEILTFEPEYQTLIDIMDRRIMGLMRSAENLALVNPSALDKIRDLYRLYNPVRRGYSDVSERQPYINKMAKEDKSRAVLSALSEAPSFWPEDALEHVQSYIFAKHTFLDDKDLEDRLLNDILSKLEKAPASKKKNECLYVLLDKNFRAAYPDTRERLFALYVQDVLAKLGKDDASDKYRSRIALYLKALESDRGKEWDIGKAHKRRFGDEGLLSNSIGSADKYVLLRMLSDAVLSQEQVSEMMKKSSQAKMTAEELEKSYLYGIGVDYLTESMDKDPQMAKQFIGFLNSRGEQGDCERISACIAKYAEKRDPKARDTIIKNTQPGQCKILYENFWSAPLEARSVIIARMLKSAVETREEKADPDREGWERVFDVVMDTLIKPDDTSVEARYARDIMHSYIKSRSDYERVLILSAMMVANRNIGGDAGNIGKALKLFLENMGPAEIKLGQAISSHPDTPEMIRQELQKLKSSARIPARWAVYDRIKSENIPEELWKEKHLGKILGAASYYMTIELGEDEVLRLLMQEAREKANKGFNVIGMTVQDLREKEATSELSYAELTTSVQEMVTQAARMSHIETDHEIGQTQYEHAKTIYNGVSINIGEQTFAFRVMDWKHKGKDWIILEKAKGPTFNALPEDTPEQIAYKKQLAIGYIILELKNILSGKKFDHDKHGDQFSVDSQTNNIGIYDTGAMALNDPTPEEQRVLGHVMYDVIKNVLQDTVMGTAHPFGSIGRTISEKIDHLHKQGIDTQYLVEVKKGLLALGDFFRVLDEGDFPAFQDAFDFNTDMSTHVREGMEEYMSLFERAQFKAFWALQSSKKHKAVVIHRSGYSQTPANVESHESESDVPDKASWLKTAFVTKDKSGGADTSGFAPFSEKTALVEWHL